MSPLLRTRIAFWLNIAILAGFVILQKKEFWPGWWWGTTASWLFLAAAVLLGWSLWHAAMVCRDCAASLRVSIPLAGFGLLVLIGIQPPLADAWAIKPHIKFAPLKEHCVIAFLAAATTTAVVLICSASVSSRAETPRTGNASSEKACLASASESPRSTLTGPGNARSEHTCLAWLLMAAILAVHVVDQAAALGMPQGRTLAYTFGFLIGGTLLVRSARSWLRRGKGKAESLEK